MVYLNSIQELGFFFCTMKYFYIVQKIEITYNKET